MKIIINADDFGKSESVNQAVFELAQKGVLSSTTVMVNMPYASEAKELIHFDNFSIGLHFNLTEGKPVCKQHDVPSLVDASGAFYPYMHFINRLKKGKIKEEHILLELRKQWETLNNIAGNNISHIDSHQNIHKQWKVANAMCKFGEQYPGLALRAPARFYIKTYGNNISSAPVFPGSFKALRNIFVSFYLKRLTARYRHYFKTPKGELHYHTGRKIDFFNWLIKTDYIPQSDRVYEIPCHPAINTSDLGNTKLKEKRREEYELLQSTQFKNALMRFNLLTFNDL